MGLAIGWLQLDGWEVLVGRYEFTIRFRYSETTSGCSRADAMLFEEPGLAAAANPETLHSGQTLGRGGGLVQTVWCRDS